MGDEVKQYALLAFAISLPIILLLLKKERLLLGWVCVTLFVQVFDTTIYTNLPAGRIVGLLFLPRALLQLKSWLGILPVRIWLLNYLYLLILAVIFGFIFPWPDITMARPFSLTAQGRSIIYSVRLLSDFSLAIFIAGQLLVPGAILYLMRCMVVGSTLTALAGLFQLATGMDMFNLITGLGEQVLNIDRARGLSLEPRAMGLASAYGIMILLLGRARIYKYWQVLLLLNLLGLLISYSASSLGLLIVGIIISTLFFTNRERITVALVSGLIVVIIFLASIFTPAQFDYAIVTLQQRIDPEYKLEGIPSGSVGQEIAYRLDVFDASAMLFMLDQPLYALIGTGPGLVSLPGSYYVPPGLYSVIWTPDIGINSPPAQGVLLELSNSGLFGLLLWVLQVYLCWKSLRFAYMRLRDQSARSEWGLAASLLLIGAAFYLIQVSSSPVWSVFLAIGWVSSRVVSEYKSRKAVPIRGIDPIRSVAGIA